MEGSDLMSDSVIVESVSRFARNTRDLLELVELLAVNGVEFIKNATKRLRKPRETLGTQGNTTPKSP